MTVTAVEEVCERDFDEVLDEFFDDFGVAFETETDVLEVPDLSEELL